VSLTDNYHILDIQLWEKAYFCTDISGFETFV